MEEIHFTCEKCVYTTGLKHCFNNHILSKKHNQMLNNTFDKNFKCECNKVFKSYTGLWRHKKMCKVLKPPTKITNKIENKIKNIANIENATLLEKLNDINKSIDRNNNLIDKHNIMIERTTNIVDKLMVEKNNGQKEEVKDNEKNSCKNPEYIYLLQEREFVESNRLIYKIGKSKQINASRIRQYPKGSILLFQKICKNCDLNETELKKLFNEKYIKHSEIGSEYFEGDYNEMIRDIFKFD
jgi:hypothetical protein